MSLKAQKPETLQPKQRAVLQQGPFPYCTKSIFPNRETDGTGSGIRRAV